MTILVVLLSLPAGCVLWDAGPYADNLLRLTDADADGASMAEGDCDDADPDVYPAAAEVCDGKDNDCNGEVDEVPPEAVWCEDLDGDGYGNIAIQTQQCFPEDGWVRDCTDCNDVTPTVNPGATETCNGIDDDCDGVTDPEGAVGSVTWYPDEDGDGYGSTDPLATACVRPEGGVEDHSDCDDGSATTYPGAPEVCGDGRINDCDASSTECGWIGSGALSTRTSAFIEGPDTRNEYLGLGVGFLDANADGVDDLMLSGVGAMYGDDSAGAVHVWYGAPVGARAVEETTTHVVGQPDLYLGASVRNPPAVRVTDPDSGESRVLFASQGFSAEFDARGVVLSTSEPLYGQVDLNPGYIFARGAVEMEGFGSTLGVSGSLADERLTLVVGAPYNSERGEFTGAVYLTSLTAPDGVDAVASISGGEHEFIGASIVCGSDMDGDGVDDLALGTGYDAEPRLYAFSGPLSGVLTTAEADAYVTDAGWTPDTTIAVPDVDGDGRPDFVTERDHGVVMHGGVLGDTAGHVPSVIGALVEDPPETSEIDFALATGDAQGDGVPDLVVGIPYLRTPAEFGDVPEAGAVAIVALDRAYNGTENLRDVASAVFYGPDARASVGLTVALGDINADNYVDMVIGAPHWSSGGYPAAGGAWFILGGGI